MFNRSSSSSPRDSWRVRVSSTAIDLLLSSALPRRNGTAPRTSILPNPRFPIPPERPAICIHYAARPLLGQLPRRLQNADFVVFPYRSLDEKIRELGDLLLVEAAGLPSLPVFLGLPHRDRDPDSRLRIRQRHRSPETRLPPGRRHDRAPVDMNHLLRVHRTDPKVNHPGVHDPTPFLASQHPDTHVSTGLYPVPGHLELSGKEIVAHSPGALSPGLRFSQVRGKSSGAGCAGPALPACHNEDLGLADEQAPSGRRDHLAASHELLTLRRREEADLVFDREHLPVRGR